MKKFIIRRPLRTIETKEIEAEDFDGAVKALGVFMGEPIPENSVLIESSCNVEFIGDI